LQSGTLDFSFVVLYLLPLLLLICLYNIKGAEADGGFLRLIYAQTGTQGPWLLARVAFYGSLIMLIMGGLMLYGAMLTPVFSSASSAFWQGLLWIFGYLLLWGVGFGLILRQGNSSIGNTLKMVGLWLLFAFIIPATIHQWVSIQQPANLMTELIDAQRDQKYEIYDLPDSVVQAHLNEMFPKIINSPVAQDSNKIVAARNRSFYALTNELAKNSIKQIETTNEERNELIQASYWFNPLSFMQNKLNSISQTDYQDYKNYRAEIQALVDKQIRVLVLDMWQDVAVDKKRYVEYEEMLSTF
ncbi:MAG: DUF3526 domain-containing protein, partial [Bacteroidota bacterium]